MSAEARADKVCSHHPEVVRLGYEEADWLLKLQEAEDAISSGYRLIGGCYEEEDEDGDIKRQCLDLPMPVDYDAEESKRVRYSGEAERAGKDADRIYADCWRRVERMGPEESFQLYQSY